MKIWRCLEVFESDSSWAGIFVFTLWRSFRNIMFAPNPQGQAISEAQPAILSWESSMKGNKSEFKSQRGRDQLLFRVYPDLQDIPVSSPTSPNSKIHLPELLPFQHGSASALYDHWRKNSMPQFPWRWKQAVNIHLLFRGI